VRRERTPTPHDLRSRFKNNNFTDLRRVSEEGPYLRRIRFCVTQLLGSRVKKKKKTCVRLRRYLHWLAGPDQRGSQIEGGHVWRDKWTALSGPLSLKAVHLSRLKWPTLSASKRVCVCERERERKREREGEREMAEGPWMTAFEW